MMSPDSVLSLEAEEEAGREVFQVIHAHLHFFHYHFIPYHFSFYTFQTPAFFHYNFIPFCRHLHFIHYTCILLFTLQTCIT